MMKKITAFSVLFLVALSVCLATGTKENNSKTIDNEFRFNSDFSSINLQWNTGDIQIKYHGQDYLTVSSPDPDFNPNIENKVLNLIGKGNKNYPISILLPQNAVLEKCLINTGMGDISVSSLNAEEVVIKANISNVNCSFESSLQTLDMKIGTGDVVISFNGNDNIKLKAPFGLGGRDFSERIEIVPESNLLVDVSVGNIKIN